MESLTESLKSTVSSLKPEQRKELLIIETIINMNNDNIFDYSNNGTVERTIFDDNINEFQHLVATRIEEEQQREFNIDDFVPKMLRCEMSKTRIIEVAALFGSVKCFKLLMLNDVKIDESICKYAISGGNYEIVHLCANSYLSFKDTLEL